MLRIMSMNREPSIVFAILDALFEFGRILPMPFETPYEHVKRIRRLDRRYYGNYVRQMEKRGVVKKVVKNGQKFLAITKKGQLQVLLEKARLPLSKKWDGKWRLIVFDIPESSNHKRRLFRSLLKANGFYKLQASVYISPHSLNRSALRFLEDSGLIDYIRVLRVDEMDNDRALRKYFKLSAS